MSIAAVPGYLGKDFSTASPGMRFGMYLSIWTHREDQEREINDLAGRKSREAHEIRQIRDEQGMDAAIAHARGRKNFPGLWEKNDFGARRAWREIAALTPGDRAVIEAINRRQQHLASLSGDATLFLPAQSTAPFTTGLGNEHPLENGFSFLWPYGLPYLPGSGIKGVLRQAARELAAGEWGESRWQAAPGGEVVIGKKKKALTTMDILFGLESKDGQQEHVRGVLDFWDVIPKIRGDRLMVEIMTPHQSHYYQNGEPPHDSGQPVPISFLTLPPGSEFPFHVICDTARLGRIAPALLEAEDGQPHWKTLLQEAFEHAFEWLGFGAKTAVGYGAMRLDEASLQEARDEREEQARQEQLARATAGLPEDAAWVEQQRAQGAWQDTNVFLDALETFLEHRQSLSSQALARLKDEMETRWKGIMANPEATRGKKNKPKYKPRPANLARKLLEFEKNAET